MKTHYPSKHSESMMKRAGVKYAEPSNSLCNTGNTGFRASVSVTTIVKDIDCKVCLRMLKNSADTA